MTDKLVLGDLRRQANLTQIEVARRLDRRQSHVSRVENATLDSLTVRTIRDYLNAIGADLHLSASP